MKDLVFMPSGESSVQSGISCGFRHLRRNNAVDFADLICLPVRLLRVDQQLRNSWRASFDHIIVDEFQDADPAQYQFVRLLLARSSSLFVVGDPSQAIYGWRGAEVNNMRKHLVQDFPRIATFHLPVNYRSVPEIIELADAIRNCGGDKDELYKAQVAARRPVAAAAAAAQRPKWARGDFPVKLSMYMSPELEAEEIAKQISNCVRAGQRSGGDGNELGDIAVLYRRRSQSRPFEEELTRRGVKYTVVGGQPFWEYKEIADAVAYLHLILAPTQSDVFLERVINTPKRGLGPRTVKQLQLAARTSGMTLGELLFGGSSSGSSGNGGGSGSSVEADFAKGVDPADVPSGSAALLATVKLTKTARKGIQDLRDLVYKLRALAADDASVDRLVDKALELSGYRAMLLAKQHLVDVREVDGSDEEKTTKKMEEDAEEAEDRLERLQMLIDLAARPEVWRYTAVDYEDEDEDEGREGEFLGDREEGRLQQVVVQTVQDSEAREGSGGSNPLSERG
ncbi:hypothetical protein VOLCADRAFT_95122 [Volvox carteri f. nagariensis]|uniref:DNA 3'-5' helicase n=1 Tax=Volvox carteri f. nagariensis TaxID=3068 RepID=D8U6N4_VOLCA|nr:uncharacterized protein VOLCADRAFT_95122 [Volvox carteri f. nagariensis]EFJ44745.1 hypothetical protein VOLCADRAFT_95122 [Volvox carteri f. nagariensis]|eukprot:XP_002954321.1 hypothetical protein VOLCADRAFT_95122 [Volvox carteri f. nagariensis]